MLPIAEPSPLRLRILMPCGSVPRWVGECLLTLDALSGIALQVEQLDPTKPASRAARLARFWQGRFPALAAWQPDAVAQQRYESWVAAAKSPCDVALLLDAKVNPAQIDIGDALLWALVNGEGRALSREFPLLAAISAGAGLHLQLWQLGRQRTFWQIRRRLHLAASSCYGEASGHLATALGRLVQQAAVDWHFGFTVRATPEAGCSTITPADKANAWWLCLKGMLRHLTQRVRAKLLSECWRIGVIDAPIHTLLQSTTPPNIRWLTPESRDGYWADPFPLPGDAQQLACEYFDYRTGLGHLESLSINADGALLERSRLMVGGGRHASFPHVVECDGQRYGVAETIALRQCVLHVVDEHGVWRPHHTLLDDVAAADPALFKWNDRWWLVFTDADQAEHDNICIHHADQINGPWWPHANNPVRVDVAGARMAGAFFERDGVLYRPGQDCLQTYGAAVVIYQVLQLTPDHYEEVAVRRLEPLSGSACPHGLHTLNAWGERTLVDGKRHVLMPFLLWRNLRRSIARCLRLSSSL